LVQDTGAAYGVLIDSSLMFHIKKAEHLKVIGGIPSDFSSKYDSFLSYFHSSKFCGTRK
jgi:hypothetical protein